MIHWSSTDFLGLLEVHELYEGLTKLATITRKTNSKIWWAHIKGDHVQKRKKYKSLKGAKKYILKKTESKV